MSFTIGAKQNIGLSPKVELAKNTGFSEHELNRIKKLVEKYADRFKEQFRQHVGKRIDD